MLVVGLLCAATVAACLVYHAKTGGPRAFKSSYDSLSIGMHLKTVLKMMDIPPKYEYRYESFRILYFQPPPDPLWNPPDPVIANYGAGQVVSNLDELPNIYDYVQLAFDSNDLLCAFTWIGESYAVESVSGPVKGAHLAKLSKLSPCPRE